MYETEKTQGVHNVFVETVILFPQMPAYCTIATIFTILNKWCALVEASDQTRVLMDSQTDMIIDANFGVTDRVTMQGCVPSKAVDSSGRRVGPPWKDVQDSFELDFQTH